MNPTVKKVLVAVVFVVLGVVLGKRIRSTIPGANRLPEI